MSAVRALDPAAAPPSGRTPSGLLARVRARASAARSRRRLHAGRGVAFGRGVRVSVAPGARVILDDGVAVGGGTRLSVTDGELQVGRDARLGERCVVVLRVGAQVGAACVLGDEVALIDVRPTGADCERPLRDQPLAEAPISVGAGARIGTGAALGPGARVPAGGAVPARSSLPIERAPRSRRAVRRD